MEIFILSRETSKRIRTIRIKDSKFELYKIFLVQQGYEPVSANEYYEPGETPLPEEPIDPDQNWKITRYAFYSRWTNAEWVTLDLASVDDPNAPMPQRQHASVIRRNFKRIDLASCVDLKDPGTIQGVKDTVSLLVYFGVIKPENADKRISEVLDTPPKETEEYVGS